MAVRVITDLLEDDNILLLDRPEWLILIPAEEEAGFHRFEYKAGEPLAEALEAYNSITLARKPEPGEEGLGYKIRLFLQSQLKEYNRERIQYYIDAGYGEDQIAEAIVEALEDVVQEAEMPYLTDKPEKPDFFTWCEELMEATGCSMDVAMREYQATFNPDYDPEDYD